MVTKQISRPRSVSPDFCQITKDAANTILVDGVMSLRRDGKTRRGRSRKRKLSGEKLSSKLARKKGTDSKKWSGFSARKKRRNAGVKKVCA